LGGSDKSIPTPLDATVRRNKECSGKPGNAIEKGCAFVVVPQDGHAIKLPIVGEVEERTGIERFTAE
jgi:hypothetical protein